MTQTTTHRAEPRDMGVKERLEFDHIAVTGLNMGAMIQGACSRCGAFVVDFPKDANGWTDARPNQDRHRVWHVEIDRMREG